MATEQKLKSGERTLIKAQQLMDKIQKQNEDWPGVGAFHKDITTAKTLLNEMQQNVSDIFVRYTRNQNEHYDSHEEIKVSQDLSETYSLMSKLYDAVNQVHFSFDNGLSQKDALIEADKYLKQLIDHCLTVRDYLKQVGHD